MTNVSTLPASRFIPPAVQNNQNFTTGLKTATVSVRTQTNISLKKSDVLSARSNQSNTGKLDINYAVNGKTGQAPVISNNKLSQAGQEDPKRLADVKLIEAGRQLGTNTPTVPNFNDAYTRLNGKDPDPKLVRMLKNFKDNPAAFVNESATDVLDTLSIAVAKDGPTFTVNPSQSAAVQANKATVFNTYNNLAWAATAREQLAISREQQAAQLRIETIQNSGLTEQQKNTKINEANLAITERNELRQQRLVVLQEISSKIQGEAYVETVTTNLKVLANQKAQLRQQERLINQSATIARAQYDQSDNQARDKFAQAAQIANQSNVFNLALSRENAYQSAKLAWNNERGNINVYQDQKFVRYDKDGWVIPPSYNANNYISMKDRLSILNDRKQAYPRPDFAALLKTFSNQSDSLQRQTETSTTRTSSKKPSLPLISEVVGKDTGNRSGGSRFSAARIKEHNIALGSALNTNRFAKLLKVARAQYPGGLSKAFETRLVQLALIKQANQVGAPPVVIQAIKAAERMLALIDNKKAPDQNQFMSNSNGTANFFFGNKAP